MAIFLLKNVENQQIFPQFVHKLVQLTPKWFPFTWDCYISSNFRIRILFILKAPLRGMEYSINFNVEIKSIKSYGENPEIHGII